MPRYHFNIRNTDPLNDEDGAILPGDLSAREHAIQIVNALQKGDEESWIGYVIEVRSRCMADPVRRSVASNLMPPYNR